MIDSKCMSYYFFFKGYNEEQRIAANALSAQLRQSLLHKPHLLACATRCHNQNGSQFDENFHFFWDILIDVSSDLKVGDSFASKLHSMNVGNRICVLFVL